MIHSETERLNLNGPSLVYLLKEIFSVDRFLHFENVQELSVLQFVRCLYISLCEFFSETGNHIK